MSLCGYALLDDDEIWRNAPREGVLRVIFTKQSQVNEEEDLPHHKRPNTIDVANTTNPIRLKTVTICESRVE